MCVRKHSKTTRPPYIQTWFWKDFHKDQKKLIRSYLDFCQRAQIAPYTAWPLDAPLVAMERELRPLPTKAAFSKVPGSSGLGTKVGGSSGPVTDRTIIELCCEHDSVIGHKKYANNGCKVVRITKGDDLTSKVGQTKALGAINGPKTHLHIALPCTGGCPWMAILMSKLGGKRKQQKHFNDFRALWRSMLPVVEAVNAAGGTMTIEWPRSCMYWKLPFVHTFMGEVQAHASLLRWLRFQPAVNCDR